MNIEDVSKIVDTVRDVDAAAIARLEKLLQAVSDNTRECSRCAGSGIEPGTENDACDICGGYGFNPSGDIRQVIVDIRDELAKRMPS